MSRLRLLELAAILSLCFVYFIMHLDLAEPTRLMACHGNPQWIAEVFNHLPTHC